MAAHLSDSNQSRENLIQGNAELRSQLGEGLRQSESKFRSIFDNVGDPVFICDMQARILEVNDVACACLGYNRDEFLTMTVMDIDAPASARLIPVKIAEMVKKDQMVFESVHRRKDGTEIHVEVNNKKIEYEGQTSILSVVRDISTRKRIESALRDSEERFRLFMDNSPTVAWMKDEHGRYVYVNKTALKRYNKSADEVIGRTDADLLAPEIAERLRQNDQDALSADHAIYYNEDMIDSDCNVSHWLNSKFPFQNSAGNRFIAGIGLEITDRKKMEESLQDSEQKFRALFEHSPDAVLLTIPHGSIEAANPAACAMLGRSEQELRDMGRSGILDTNDPRLSAVLEERDKTGYVKAVELTAIRKCGEKFSVEVDSAILPGEPVRSFVIMRDITERKQAEEELKNALKQAREERQQLDAMMEHIPMGIAIAEAPDVLIKAVSRCGRELTGKPPEQIEGIPIGQHAEKWQIFRADGKTPASNEDLPLTRATQKGEVVKDEEWVIGRPDGTMISTLCTAAPIRDASGQITGGVIGWQDITERKRTQLAIVEGKRLSEALNFISDQVHSRTKSAEIIQCLVAEGASALGCETAAISLREDEGWRVQYVHGMPNEMIGTRMTDEQEQHAVDAITSREPVSIEDAFNDQRFNREHLRRYNIRSVLVVPLILKGHPFGALFFNYHHTTHCFTEAESKVFTAVGEHGRYLIGECPIAGGAQASRRSDQPKSADIFRIDRAGPVRHLRRRFRVPHRPHERQLAAGRVPQRAAGHRARLLRSDAHPLA